MSHTIFPMVNEKGKTEIKWNYNLLSSEYLEQLRLIHSVYDTRYFIWLNDTRKKLKPKHERTCRFCGKSYPDVKFSSKAHVFPESVGNKYHLSDFECDNCNHKFGVYENDFANYIGPFRTLAEFTGKSGVPKYKSRDKKLSLNQAFKDAIDLNLSAMSLNNRVVNKADGSGLLIQAEGDPYIPINVYRCLLKTAISLVDNEDLKHLSASIKFLLDDNYITDPSNDFIFSIHKYFVPGNFNAPPFLIHYKKGNNFIGFPAPSLMFIFYIRNLILQLFVPFHDNDSFIYDSDVERHLYIVPPLINSLWFNKFGGPFPGFTNLNNSSVIEKNIQVFDWKVTKK